MKKRRQGKGNSKDSEFQKKKRGSYQSCYYCEQKRKRGEKGHRLGYLVVTMVVFMVTDARYVIPAAVVWIDRGYDGGNTSYSGSMDGGDRGRKVLVKGAAEK